MNINDDTIEEMAECIRASERAWQRVRLVNVDQAAVAILAAEFYRKAKEDKVLNGLLEPVEYE